MKLSLLLIWAMIVFYYSMASAIETKEKVNIEITARGCTDVCGDPACTKYPGSISINGEIYGPTGPGLYIVALHQQTGKMIKNKHLTRSGGARFSRYSAFFESIPIGSVVMVTTRSLCHKDYSGWYNLIAKYLDFQSSKRDKEGARVGAAIVVTCRGRCPSNMRGDTFPYQVVAEPSHGPLRATLQLTFPGNSSQATLLPCLEVTIPHPSTTIATTHLKPGSNERLPPKNPGLLKIGDRIIDRKWLITGIALGSVILLTILFVFTFMYLRKRHRSRGNGVLVTSDLQNHNHNEPLGNPANSYSKTTSIYANVSDTGYLKVSQNTYEEVSHCSSVSGSPCNSIVRHTQGSPPEIRVYVEPASTCLSTSPSNSYNLFAERRSECYPDFDNSPPQFAEYVSVTRDGPIYKKPSNVLKHAPPKERPPSRETSKRDSYVCMQPHEYEAPSSPYETAIFIPDEPNNLYEKAFLEPNNSNDLYETAVFVPRDPDTPEYANGNMANPIR